MNSLSDRLKIVREKMGKTQKEMALLIGVSYGSLQVYEEGKSVPGGKVLAALSRQGFDVNWILTGEGEMRRGAAAQPGPVDKELLLSIMKAVDEYLEEIVGRLTREKKNLLIVTLYELCVEEGTKSVEKAKVISLFKLAA
jgi:transcriptional regulator with XRE-family HTH domain